MSAVHQRSGRLGNDGNNEDDERCKPYLREREPDMLPEFDFSETDQEKVAPVSGEIGKPTVIWPTIAARTISTAKPN